MSRPPSSVSSLFFVRKQYAQYTGRYPFGWNGTRVGAPHSAQLTSAVLLGSSPLRWTRINRRQFGQRLGSLTSPFALKNSCSPAENTKVLLQSRQLSDLS